MWKIPAAKNLPLPSVSSFPRYFHYSYGSTDWGKLCYIIRPKVCGHPFSAIWLYPVSTVCYRQCACSQIHLHKETLSPVWCGWAWLSFKESWYKTPPNIYDLDSNTDWESDLLPNIRIGPHWCSRVRMEADLSSRFNIKWKQHGGCCSSALINMAEMFVSSHFWQRLSQLAPVEPNNERFDGALNMKLLCDCVFAITLHCVRTLLIRLKLMNLSQFFRVSLPKPIFKQPHDVLLDQNKRVPGWRCADNVNCQTYRESLR